VRRKVRVCAVGVLAQSYQTFGQAQYEQPEAFGTEWHLLALNDIAPHMAIKKVRPEGLEPPTLGSEVAPSFLDAFGTFRKHFIYQGVTLSLLFGDASVKVRFCAYVGG